MINLFDAEMVSRDDLREGLHKVNTTNWCDSVYCYRPDGMDDEDFRQAVFFALRKRYGSGAVLESIEDASWMLEAGDDGEAEEVTITVTFREAYAGKTFRTFDYCVSDSEGGLSVGLDSCETFTAEQAEAIMDAVEANAEAERLTFPNPEAVSFYIEVE